MTLKAPDASRELLPRVPGWRALSKMPSTLLTQLANDVGHALHVFALAQIEVLRQAAVRLEEEPLFDNEAEDAPDRPWLTFAMLAAGEPSKSVTHPITVSTEAKIALASMLVSVADLINHAEGLAVTDPLAELAGLRAREANLVAFMSAVVAQAARPHLCADPLSRNMNWPQAFQLKVEKLVASRELVDPGANLVARLYLDFVKVVAWNAGTLAYEHGHLTLNRATLFGILAQMALLTPASVPSRDVLSLVRRQVTEWETARKAKAKAKAKLSPKTKAVGGKTGAGARKAGAKAPVREKRPDTPTPTPARPRIAVLSVAAEEDDDDADTDDGGAAAGGDGDEEVDAEGLEDDAEAEASAASLAATAPLGDPLALVYDDSTLW